MAANTPDANEQWERLEDPYQAAARDLQSRTKWRFAAKYLTVMGIMGLAAGTIYYSSSPQAPPAAALEMVALPSQVAEVTTVKGFNDLLASSIVMDPKAMYEEMSADRFEMLFEDFLTVLGSRSPGASGIPRTKSKTYSSQKEKEYRLGIFKQNLLAILKDSAKEYGINSGESRARFGITVHADWTLDEFTNKRLNLKANNITALLAQAAKVAAAQDEAARNEARKEKIREEARRLFSCSVETGGTCLLLPCHANRGSICYNGACVCTDGACEDSEGHCTYANGGSVATGGSCHVFGCGAWRHAQCRNGACICPPGKYARAGACVDAPPDRNSDVTCSRSMPVPVRDQGSCGSCWAFSASEQLRFMTMKKYNQDPGQLSAQYLLDCDPDVKGHTCSEGVQGCCGGLPLKADQWLEGSGGIPTTDDYGAYMGNSAPNTAQQCKGSTPKKVRPTGGYKVYSTESKIANAFCEKGPVSIAIAVGSPLQHYTGGYMTVDSCPANRINHAVVYVGVDKTHFRDQVHIILNSWGADWGVSSKAPYKNVPGGTNGHVLFKYGDNTCNVKGLATQPGDVELL